MKFFLLIFTSVLITMSSMGQPDYHHVIGNKGLCKKNAVHYCSCDSAKQIGHICDSKKEMEIRLTYTDSTFASFIYLLSYDSSKWNLKLILDSLKYDYAVKKFVSKFSKTYSLVPQEGFEKMFNDLVTNKVFRLESVIELGGIPAFHLSYKAGQKIRAYYFPDLDALQKQKEHYQAGGLTKKEIENYEKIVEIFSSQFNQQKERDL